MEVISLKLQLRSLLTPHCRAALWGHSKPLPALWAHAGGGFGAAKSLYHPPAMRHSQMVPV